MNSGLQAETQALLDSLQPHESDSVVRDNHLDYEYRRLITILRDHPATENHLEIFLVYPFIPTFFPKRRRGQTDFIVRVHNLQGFFTGEIYYRPKAEDKSTLYQNIKAAYTRCYDILEIVTKHLIDTTANAPSVRVSLGCFNYRGIPYKVLMRDKNVVDIEVHSRFKSDQKDQIIPLITEVMDYI